MKRKDTMMESQSHICPNPSCGKSFITPIKVENLCSKTTEVYDACPFCLIEITVEKNLEPIEEKKTVTVQKDAPKKEGLAELSPPVQKCAHHLGYLSKRPSKDKIPEECIVCENIVQCMLKNVTG